MDSDPGEALIDFALGEVVPSARARRVVELSLADWAACGIAGFEEGTFKRWVAQQRAPGPAPTFAGKPQTGGAAALVNGTLSHALDFDDTHFGHIGHPSVVILPAVLAAGPASWDDLCAAALVGMEASVRVGIWLGPRHYEDGFHMTATAGAFGAALGLARGRRMSPDQARHGMGLTASQAAGLKAQFGTMGKPLNAGLAARAGLEAMTWANGDTTGARSGLGRFAAAHGGPRTAGAFDGLGRDWLIERLSYKLHACCHGLHAMLEALRHLPLRGQLARLTVRTHPKWLKVCAIPEPETGLEAKFSYAHTAAMALSGIDTGRIGNFADELARDASLRTLRRKVAVVGDDSLSDMQCAVTLTDGAGTREARHDLAISPDLDDLAARLRTKADGLIGPERAAGLWRAVDAGDLNGYLVAAFGAG